MHTDAASSFDDSRRFQRLQAQDNPDEPRSSQPRQPATADKMTDLDAVDDGRRDGESYTSPRKDSTTGFFSTH